MLKSEYLKGIRGGEMLVSGWLYFPHHCQPGQHRLVTTYAIGQRGKGDLFNLLKHFGSKHLVNEEWDLHHIVEGRHIVDVDFWGQYDQLYEYELPCILLHKSEHSLYTRLASIRQTKVLYLDNNLSGDSQARASQTASEFSSLKANQNQKQQGEQLARLQARLNKLRQLYHHAYGGEPLMQTIARNVLDVAGEKLNIR
jgi:hypothetical protein